MTLFVTGAASFVGRELLRHCDEKAIDIVGVDLVDAGRSDCTIADIRDPSIADAIPENIDAIIHLAALSRDPDCRDKAIACFDANVMGTLNLIEAAKTRNAGQFIFASSEWVYDSFEDGVAKTEDDPINAANLTSEYAFSKYVSEVNLRQKFQHGFCPVTILRFGIIYGPRKDNWSAVEALLNTVATKEEVTVGALTTGRCFIHVSDIASGILAAIGLQGCEIINLQGEKLVSLDDVIDASKKLTGRSPKIIESNPGQPNVRLVSGEKAKSAMDWGPSINLEKGLESVAASLGLLK